jgi:hypothetical protein
MDRVNAHFLSLKDLMLRVVRGMRGDKPERPDNPSQNKEMPAKVNLRSCPTCIPRIFPRFTIEGFVAG